MFSQVPQEVPLEIYSLILYILKIARVLQILWLSEASFQFFSLLHAIEKVMEALTIIYLIES